MLFVVLHSWAVERADRSREGLVALGGPECKVCHLLSSELGNLTFAVIELVQAVMDTEGLVTLGALVCRDAFVTSACQQERWSNRVLAQSYPAESYFC